MTTVEVERQKQASKIRLIKFIKLFSHTQLLRISVISDPANPQAKAIGISARFIPCFSDLTQLRPLVSFAARAEQKQELLLRDSQTRQITLLQGVTRNFKRQQQANGQQAVTARVATDPAYIYGRGSSARVLEGRWGVCSDFWISRRPSLIKKASARGRSRVSVSGALSKAARAYPNDYR